MKKSGNAVAFPDFSFVFLCGAQSPRLMRSSFSDMSRSSAPRISNVRLIMICSSAGVYVCVMTSGEVSVQDMTEIISHIRHRQRKGSAEQSNLRDSTDGK